MNFKYSCIGDNTPENREHLRILGWKEKYYQEDADTIVCASNTGMFSIIAKDTQSWFKEYQSECTNCIGNPQLFQAVTAIRKDSDCMQWFVWDVDIFTRDYETRILEKGSFELSDDKDFIGIHDDYPKEAHKATLEELINHFSMDVCPDNNPMKVFRKKA
ncbi:MAG: hypothetical protein QM660_10705 [Dysgonomonas sp.]